MSTTTYDRTRWDRLQATLLIAVIAAASCIPTWLGLAVLTGHVIVGTGQ